MGPSPSTGWWAIANGQEWQLPASMHATPTHTNNTTHSISITLLPVRIRTHFLQKLQKTTRP